MVTRYDSACQKALGNNYNDPVFMAKLVFYINSCIQQAMIDCCQYYGYDGKVLEYLQTEAFRLLYDWVKSNGNSAYRKQHNPQMEYEAQMAAHDFIRCWLQHHLGVFAARLDAERRAAELQQLFFDAEQELELRKSPKVVRMFVAKRKEPFHKVLKTSPKKKAEHVFGQANTSFKRFAHRSATPNVHAKTGKEAAGPFKRIVRGINKMARSVKQILVPVRSTSLSEKAEMALMSPSLVSVVDRRCDSAVSLTSSISTASATTSVPVRQQPLSLPINRLATGSMPAPSSASNPPTTHDPTTLSASLSSLNLSTAQNPPAASVAPPNQLVSASAMPAPPTVPVPPAMPAQAASTGLSTLLSSLTSLSMSATLAAPSSLVFSAAPTTTAAILQVSPHPASSSNSNAAQASTIGLSQSNPITTNTSIPNVGQVSTTTPTTTSANESSTSNTDQNSSAASPADSLPKPLIDSAVNTSTTVGANADSLTSEDSALIADPSDAAFESDNDLKDGSIVAPQITASNTPVASTLATSITASTSIAPTLSSTAPAISASAPESSSQIAVGPSSNDATINSIYADLSFEPSSDPAVNDRAITDMLANMTKRKKNTAKYKAEKEKQKQENKQRKVEKEITKVMNKLGLRSSNGRLSEADKRRKLNQRR
jgi:hypothetical protein